MKKLQHLFATLVFVLVLSSAAIADDGIIHGDRTQPQPPPSVAGIIHGDVASTGEEIKSEDTSADVAMEIALSLVKSILALF